MSEYNYIVSSPNELYHYGVKGMKWGVRRYQNADGSYTEAGQRRNLKQIRKAAKTGGGRPTLGGTVGKNELTTSAADKVRSTQVRLAAAQNRASRLYGQQEMEDHKKFDDFCSKNKRWPTEQEHKKMQQETYRKYKDKIVKAEQETRKLYDEYATDVKRVTNEILGKYGNEPVSYRVRKRKVTITAEQWLKIEMNWGNEIRKDSYEVFD